MKLQIFSIILISLLLSACAGGPRRDAPPGDRYTFSDSSSSLRASPERIDSAPTYEFFFALDSEVNCITIDLEAVHIEEEFPRERIERNSYFIVEKVLDTERFTGNRSYSFTPLARNFNREWERFNPLTICSLDRDPMSRLDKAVYRVRFTVFDPAPVLFMVTIYSEEAVTFRKTIQQ